MEILTDPRGNKNKKIFRILLLVGAGFLLFSFLSYSGLFLYAKMAGPPPLTVPQSTVYYADDGTVIGETDSGGKRYWVGLDEISPYFKQAAIAVEDQRFYSHSGFDYKRILAAIFADLKAMAKVQGASTITQQYARNLYLTHDKTWARKIKEALYTIRLEANYGKDEILEGYLNTIYFGHGAYGVEAASRFYFGKKAKDLDLAEAAILAGIPKGPSLFSPVISFERAKKRQKLVLKKMAENGMISEEEAEEAFREELHIAGKHPVREKIAPYFQDAVQQELKRVMGLDERTIALGGLKVYTSLDPKMQKSAEENMAKTSPAGSGIQAALVAMDPQTGFVKAMIGGRDYAESSFNRAVKAIRQPGSTVKPFLYFAALEHGFTPSSTLRSEETTFYYDEGRRQYAPKNFNGRYAEGNLTMAQALALSDNIYAVKTHLFLGMETLKEYMEKFGITSKQEAVPSLALGTSGVSVIEMAKAYSLFANGGTAVEPRFIQKVVGKDGQVIYEYKKKTRQLLDPKTAFVMTHMMTGMFDPKLNGYAAVTGSSMLKKATRIYAGKSGSTNTDSWMIGFTPDLLAAVWTGYDDNRAIAGSREKAFAKNLWIGFMEDALKGKPLRSFQPPKGVTGVWIDPTTGLLATDSCPVKRLTYYVENTEPTEFCAEHPHLPPDSEKGAEPRHREIEDGKKAGKPWYRRFFDWFD